MNKKEVLEIQKQLKKDNCHVNRICGCYVDGHKEKIATMKEAFLSLPEEEMFKYSDILKKTLSGSVGKNLLNLEFPLKEEVPGGRQQQLLALRDSELKDEDMVNAFYDKVIETYLDAENYLILLVYGTYDVPGHTSDGLELEDASDYVYSFLLCSICPVCLSKAGLCYDASAGTFIDKAQDRMVQMPAAGFLFPSFNDRNTDIHSLLYYSKNPDLLHPELITDLLGCVTPLPADDQKTTFNEVIEETFGENCDFETAKSIHENMNALLEGKKEEPEPTPLEKNEIRHLLEHCGARPEQLERFDAVYRDDPEGGNCLLASNLANTRKFEVSSDDVKISVSSSRTDLIESRIIDGTEYILIPVTGNVEVNGIKIRSGSGKTEVPKD